MLKKILAILAFIPSLGWAAADSFTELNNFAGKLAEEGVTEKVPQLPYVIVAFPNRFTALYLNGELVQQIKSLSPISILSKNIDHTSIALFELLYPFENKEIRKEKIGDFVVLIDKAQEELFSLNLEKSYKKRQLEILDKSKAILQKTLRLGKLDAKEYRNFFEEIRPLLNLNTKEALFQEFNLLCETLKQWRREMSPEDWNQIIVLLIGPQLLLNKNTYEQFFQKLLNIKSGLDRLIFIDNITDPKVALRALAEIKFNRSLGEVVLGKPDAALHDIYSDLWKSYMDKIIITPDGCFYKEEM
jgi:hypothetical protein